jgi:hypothetical protein
VHVLLVIFWKVLSACVPCDFLEIIEACDPCDFLEIVPRLAAPGVAKTGAAPC